MKRSFPEAFLTLSKGLCVLTLAIIASAVATKVLYLDPGAFDRLFGRAETVEVGDAKIVLREFVPLDPKLNLAEDDQRKIWEEGRRLASWEFDRLLGLPDYDRTGIGDRDAICEFDRATSRMRLAAAAEEGLIEKALAERIWRPDLTKAMQEENAKHPFVAGNPSHCHQIVLTGLGRGLKSLVVAELARAGGSRLAQGAAPDATGTKTEDPRVDSSRETPTRNRISASLL